MITLEKVATLLSEHPSSLIFYSKTNKNFIITSNLEIMRAQSNFQTKGNKIVKGVPEHLKDYLKNPEDFYDLFYYEKEIKELKNVFIKDHQELIEFEKGRFSHFINALKEKELFEEWIEFVKQKIAFIYYDWMQFVNEIDIEASKAQYNKLISLLIEYKKNKFESSISDSIVFDFSSQEEPFSFIVMGNAGITRGIQFNIGEHGIELFKILNSSEYDLIEKRTFNYLQDMISLYTDNKQDLSKFFARNPFSQYKYMSSIHINNGNFEYSRLSECEIILVTKFLRKAIDFLKQFIGTEEYKEATSYQLARVFPDNAVFDLTKDIEAHFPIDPDRNDFRPLPLGNKIIDREVEFKITGLDAFKDNNQDKRIRNSALALMLLNEDTRTVNKIVVKDVCDYSPLNDLSDTIHKELKDHELPNEIIVNNFYDYVFASTLFKHYIKTKKIHLKRVSYKLEIDYAIEDLNEELVNGHFKDDDVHIFESYGKA